MTEEKDDSAVIQVKINMENDEIEVIESPKQEEDINDNLEHYIITEIKGVSNDVYNVVLTNEDAPVDEEDQNSDDGGDEGDKVSEVVEHFCGKCFKSYSNVERLKTHLNYCRTQVKIENTLIHKEYIKELENNLSKVEEEAKKMDDAKICFCCEEDLATCHSGHIRCYECPKSFKNSKSFERHLFLIHSGNENFPCETCNARCPSEGILKVHEQSHKRGKPYACKTCGKEFTRSYHLSRHKQYSSCDKSTQKKEIVCKVCGKVFYRLDNLRSHLRQHLGDEAKKRDYKCPMCEKSFFGTATLK